MQARLISAETMEPRKVAQPFDIRALGFDSRISLMKKIMKVTAAILLAVVVLVVGGLALSNAGIQNPISQAADQAGTGAANAALDAIGIKEKADSMLHENAGKIAQMTGLPESMVNGMIDDLDVQSWQVASLPSEATALSSTDVSYNGMTVWLTTYDDPSVVTVDTDLGTVSLAVPESAQSTIKLLQDL